MLFALIAALVIVVVLVAAAMSLFLWRHGGSARPEPGWVRTDEVFADLLNWPLTGPGGAANLKPVKSD